MNPEGHSSGLEPTYHHWSQPGISKNVKALHFPKKRCATWWDPYWENHRDKTSISKCALHLCCHFEGPQVGRPSQRKHSFSPAWNCSRPTSTKFPSMKSGNDPFDFAFLPKSRLFCKASFTMGSNFPTSLHKVSTLIYISRYRSLINTAFWILSWKKGDMGRVASIPVIAVMG